MKNAGWLSLALIVSCLSCGGNSQQPKSRASRAAPVSFSLAGIDGTRQDGRAFLGRVTVILFATTFDISSQAQAQQLEDLYRTHVPRVNALLVVLEPAKNVELVRGFRDVLGLNFPVAMADPQTLTGQGVFGTVSSVPSWLFLDGAGRPTNIAEGQLSPAQLREAVLEAQ